ncbi:MAG: hypothetical protein AAGJ35_13155, partial [Myxococcota bacterium]
ASSFVNDNYASSPSNTPSPNTSNWGDGALTDMLQEQLASMGSPNAQLLHYQEPLFQSPPTEPTPSFDRLTPTPTLRMQDLPPTIEPAPVGSLLPSRTPQTGGTPLYQPKKKDISEESPLYPSSPNVEDLSLPGPAGRQSFSTSSLEDLPLQEVSSFYQNDSLSGEGSSEDVPFDTSMVYSSHGVPELLSLAPSEPSGFTEHVDLSSSRAPDERTPALDPEWIKIRLKDGQEVGPMTLQEVRSLYAHNKISIEDMCCGRDQVWVPITSVQEIAEILMRTPQITEPPEAERKPKRNKASSPGRTITLWSILSILLIGGGVTAAVILRDFLGAKPSNPDVKNKGVADLILLHKKIASWNKKQGGAKVGLKRSKEMSKQGWKLLVKDQASDYKRAQSLFQQSLLGWK